MCSFAIWYQLTYTKIWISEHYRFFLQIGWFLPSGLYIISDCYTSTFIFFTGHFWVSCVWLPRLFCSHCWCHHWWCHSPVVIFELIICDCKGCYHLPSPNAITKHLSRPLSVAITSNIFAIARCHHPSPFPLTVTRPSTPITIAHPSTLIIINVTNHLCPSPLLTRQLQLSPLSVAVTHHCCWSLWVLIFSLADGNIWTGAWERERGDIFMKTGQWCVFFFLSFKT